MFCNLRNIVRIWFHIGALSLLCDRQVRSIRVKYSRISDANTTRSFDAVVNPGGRTGHHRHSLSKHHTSTQQVHPYTVTGQWERLGKFLEHGEKDFRMVTDKNVVDLVNRLQVDWECLPTLSLVKKGIEEEKDVMAAQTNFNLFKALMGPQANIQKFMQRSFGNPFRLPKEQCQTMWCGVKWFEMRQILYLEAGLDMMADLKKSPLQVQSVVTDAASAQVKEKDDSFQGWITQNMDEAQLSLDEDKLRIEPANGARILKKTVRIDLTAVTEIGPSGPNAIPNDYRDPRGRTAKILFADAAGVEQVLVLVFHTGYERQAFVAGLMRKKDPSELYAFPSY